MTDEQPKPNRTRRPRGLTSHLTDLRDQNDRAIAKLAARRDRLDVELGQVLQQLEHAHAERARLNLAIGDARDNERSDVDGPQIVLTGDSTEGLEALVRNNARLLDRAGGDVDRAMAPAAPVVQGVEVVRTHPDGTETVDSTHATVDAAVAAAHGEARVINGAAE